MSSSATDPDEIFSDESSFYGDEDEQARLEELAATYDPEPYWSEVHPRLLSTAQYELLAPTRQPPASEAALDTKIPSSDSLPRNSRDPTESIPHFLSRLPPSTTPTTTAGPWIWMRHDHSASATTSRMEGDGDEGDVATLVRRGTELLHAFEDESARLRAAHEQSGARTTAPLTRKLNALRRTLEQDISSLARETHVLSGKWMLFPSEDRVDAYWGAVVEALDKGELGTVAKVAAREESGSADARARLICVYTADFEDKEDVKRVLRGLVQAGLVDEAERPIYYKCDAYTYLDIRSKNDFGLKASLFSSRDMLSGKV